MKKIISISDLNNNFVEVEKSVESGEPVYLTKNGGNTMVLLSLEAYSDLTDGVMQPLKQLIDMQREMIKDIHIKKFFLVLEECIVENRKFL